MRRGWGYWILGNLLGIMAIEIAVSLYVSSVHAVPPLPLSFTALYGAGAVACGLGAAFMMLRGWKLLHIPAPRSSWAG